MLSLKGKVSKIRLLKMSDHPLVFFKLDDINCLISTHSLSFLADVADGTQIVIAGNYNKQNQFVCRRYSVIGRPQIILEIEHSRYPSRKIV